MQLSHTRPVVSATFDDPNLMSAAGLVPIMKLAETAGPRSLVQKWLTVPTDKGAHAGVKVTSLVGGMVAGADSIDLWSCCATAGWPRSSPPAHRLLPPHVPADGLAPGWWTRGYGAF